MEENSKTYILDASYLLSYLLPDEQTDTVMEIFQKHEAHNINFVSTQILFFEVSNALLQAVRKKRLDMELAHGLLASLEDLAIKISDVDPRSVLDLANKHGLSFYDSSYLSLSQTTNFPLLTLDKQLKKLSS